MGVWRHGLAVGRARALVTHLGMPLNDTTIAMAGGVALFILPSGSEREGALLAWSDTARLPWDILLLFGGGLTLAGQLSDAGVLDAVAQRVSSAPAMSPGMLIAGFVLVSLFLTEVMSNLALTVVMVPVVAQIALSWDMNPLLLVVPVTMASSCAFMLPMATPPNAIVFGSGRLRMSNMVRVGVVLNGGRRHGLVVGVLDFAELGATLVSGFCVLLVS